MVIKIQNMSFVQLIIFSSFLILFDIFYIVQIAMTWDLRQFLTRKWKMSSVYAFIIAWQKWNMWTRDKIKTTTKCYRKIGLCQKSFLVIVIMQHLFFVSACTSDRPLTKKSVAKLRQRTLIWKMAPLATMTYTQ